MKYARSTLNFSIPLRMTAAIACLVLSLAHLAGWADLVLVGHRVCAVDGALVHSDSTGGHDCHAPEGGPEHYAKGSDAAVAILLPADTEHQDEHRHHHCPSILNSVERALTARHSTVLIAGGVPPSTPVTAPVVRSAMQIPPLILAPKNSPPLI